MGWTFAHGIQKNTQWRGRSLFPFVENLVPSSFVPQSSCRSNAWIEGLPTYYKALSSPFPSPIFLTFHPPRPARFLLAYHPRFLSGFLPSGFRTTKTPQTHNPEMDSEEEKKWQVSAIIERLERDVAAELAERRGKNSHHSSIFPSHRVCSLQKGY